jgi:hypothetical protein
MPIDSAIARATIEFAGTAAPIPICQRRAAQRKSGKSSLEIERIGRVP